MITKLDNGVYCLAIGPDDEPRINNGVIDIDKSIRIPLPKYGKWEILGTATEKEINVDLNKVVESYTRYLGYRADGDKSKMPKITMYMNYKYTYPVPVTFLFTNPVDSFNSLLTSKDIYFTNPMGREPLKNLSIELRKQQTQWTQWNLYQQKVIHKLLILKDKNDTTRIAFTY